MKTALITGVSGQDGSYLAELLISKHYDVHGLIRRTAQHPDNLSYIPKDVTLHFGDITTGPHLCSIVRDLKPDEIYHLAAQSDVRVSFDTPEHTGDVVALGTTRLLEAVRTMSPRSRVYNASTSEMYGSSPPPQNELTPFAPANPYAVAKLYAHHMCLVYRKSYDMFVSCGILFNHESPRRGKNFLTRKIISAATKIAQGERQEVYLGNLNARRDWGYAPEYCEAMWLMLQQSHPDDFVIGTGESHSVRDFVAETFNVLRLDWKQHVKLDPMLLRPSETPRLLADATKARTILGWTPKVSFVDLIHIMLREEVKRVRESETQSVSC